MPFSWLLLRYLSIAQSTNTAVISARTRATAQTFSSVLQVRHQTIGAALNNTSTGAIEIPCLASRRLPTTEIRQCLVQRFSVGRVHRHLSRNSDEQATGGYLHCKEIHPCLAMVMQKQTEKSASRTHNAERTQRLAAHTAPSKAHTPSTARHHTTTEKQNKNLCSLALALLGCQQTRANDDASAGATMLMT